MDHERKELLAQKKRSLEKQQRAEIQQYKDRLTKASKIFLKIPVRR